MKIGILTFHNIPNIGAILQAYGLCTTFKRNGFDCELIDYVCDNIVERELTFHPKQGTINNIIAKYIWKKTIRKIHSCQNFLISRHMYGNKQYNSSNISDANDEYDVFISGSDMIWNLQITNNDYTYFLDFVYLSKKKYSYGSSIGNTWDNRELSLVRDYLKSYSLLSVREEDTCEVINAMGLQCKHVVDPTMLITKEEWSKLAKKPKEKEYVLVYFPTKENKRAAKRYAKKYNKKVVIINMWLPTPGVINVSPYDPTEWIGYFENAFAVFTDSYHGILFSIYFKKPFWTGNNGNRIMSLLGQLSLNSRLISQNTDYSMTIDYEKVEGVIDSLREDSMNYIKNIILDINSN